MSVPWKQYELCERTGRFDALRLQCGQHRLRGERSRYRGGNAGWLEFLCWPDKDLLGGTTILQGTGWAATSETAGGALYSLDTLRQRTRVAVHAIPYYAWDNRSGGAMRVRIPLS